MSGEIHEPPKENAQPPVEADLEGMPPDAEVLAALSEDDIFAGAGPGEGAISATAFART